MNSLILATRSSLKTCFKMSHWAQFLIIVIILLAIAKYYNTNNSKKLEGFQSRDTFELKENNDIYDEFYTNIYDELYFYKRKNVLEKDTVEKDANATSESIILDVGSGTGHHVDILKFYGIQNVRGVDSSEAMVKKAKENYPAHEYIHGDALKQEMFSPDQFTHITCFYYTIYAIEDKNKFFSNCMVWLKPGGYLVVHAADRDNFDPIITSANPLMSVSPQRYATKRITTSKVVFDDFIYSCEYQFKNDDNVDLIEKFSNRKDGKLFRKQKSVGKMEDTDHIIQMAKNAGFTLISEVDMVKVQHEYEYLYVFQKPE